MITASRLPEPPGDAGPGLLLDRAAGRKGIDELLGPSPAILEAGKPPRDRSLLSGAGREALVGALRDQPGARSGAPAQRDAIDALLGEETLAVVAGQQPGLFLGPLLTLYKALSAVALARRLSRAAGRRVVPVFWIAAEDDDPSEIATALLTASDGSLRRLRLFDGGEPPAPAVYAGMRVGDRLRAIAGEIGEAIGGMPHGERLARAAADAAREETPVSAFGSLLGGLLGPLGLIVLDPSDPRLKRLLAPVFARERAAPLETAREARSAGLALESLGYRPQVRLDGDRTDLFLRDGARRARLAPGDGRDHAPELLVPGALLRPVCQDFLLPTAAIVAGPSEAAYLAQAGGVYARHGVPRPVIVPRLSAVLIEPVVSRFLERTGTDLAALARGAPEAPPSSAAAPPDPLLAGAREAANALDAALVGLAEELATSAPPLADMVLSSRRRVAGEISRVEERIARERDRSGDDLRRRSARARERIAPDGRPQERVHSPLSFLARWENLVPFLEGAYDPADPRPLLVRLGEPDGAASQERAT